MIVKKLQTMLPVTVSARKMPLCTRSSISSRCLTSSNSSILVLNCGSTSIKFKVFANNEKGLTNILDGNVSGISKEKQTPAFLKVKQQKETIISESLNVYSHSSALSVLSDIIATNVKNKLAAVGHRIVHGGTSFINSTVIDNQVLATLKSIENLAPLHNPHNVAGVVGCLNSLPDALQVGVFDTAFHSTIPEYAYRSTLPGQLGHKYRKYGFHGTSHKFVVERAANYLRKDKINAVSFHLGGGCSVTCIQNNKSIDTTMGYTPLAGLLMGTRSGTIDPSIVLNLAQDEGYSVAEISDILNNKSGFSGLCGTPDGNTVEQMFFEGDPRAKLAMEMFCYQAKLFLGSYVAVLGEVDCVIFTGGIGENSPVTHEMICSSLYPVSHDHFSRSHAVSDISRDTTDRTRVLVVKTDEELAIARECLTFIETEG